MTPSLVDVVVVLVLTLGCVWNRLDSFLCWPSEPPGKQGHFCATGLANGCFESPRLANGKG